jgi:beta-glucosidase
LRQRWGFAGFVVSDGGAILENWRHHKYEATPEEAAANAVKAGCDLFSGAVAPADNSEGQKMNVGNDFEALGRMLQKGLLSETEIDAAVSRTLAARFRLGLFDPPSMVSFSKIGIDQNDTAEHRALALRTAEESIVLLKNDGVLPLDRAKLRCIAVIGPNANSANMLLGNYNGEPSRSTTILDGIKQAAGPNIEVTYAAGCPLVLKKDDSNKPKPETTAQAVAIAKSADVIVFVSGIDSSLEKEHGDPKVQGFLGGDRTSIEMPTVQEDLIQSLYAIGKPVILVNCSGSAIAMPWEAKNLPAIVQAWYPGEEGGRAVARVLFGDVNPAGRLPITFYASTRDLPPFEDYAMANRTYRYFVGKPLYAFGHGLSYTKFEYSDAAIAVSKIGADETIKLSFRVKNTGNRDGDEVPQVYFRHVISHVAQAKLALCAFKRVSFKAGESASVSVDIPAQRLRYWETQEKKYIVETGEYELLIGSASDSTRLKATVTVK